MVQAQELRIGNYVMFGKSRGTVFNFIYERPGWYVINGCPQSDISPIPLTPELLEKCGFEKGANSIYITEDEKWFIYFNEYRIWLQTERQGDSEYICERMEIKIQYLHQLQNLYFSLVGEELIINLVDDFNK
jgi:hypothetical protein